MDEVAVGGGGGGGGGTELDMGEQDLGRPVKLRGLMGVVPTLISNWGSNAHGLNDKLSKLNCRQCVLMCVMTATASGGKSRPQKRHLSPTTDP
ncbi:hypothetical protein Pmani_007737 [Petrolisthes manimaculis]|uniref:Uncharacterized protein n=1 Tax=Petrolisthes manimaculis TaxID=1843537 RepID=A0AAE1Q8C1_9EUCA|nr:hypothetical protein Pmani_007737 [Petrolisthes manimaculis]